MEGAFGVLKITVVHLHARTFKNTSSFTNYVTYNFQLISIKYRIFSNNRPGHLFQNLLLIWAAYSTVRLIDRVAYSTVEKKYLPLGFQKTKKTSQN